MNKTWFIDIDGTLVKHLDESEIEKGGREELVPYAVEFMEGIQKRGDTVVLTTARPEEFRSLTVRMLKDFGIEYDHIIFELAHRERILVNDIKPVDELHHLRDEPLPTAYAINLKRNEGFGDVLTQDLWEKPAGAKEKVFDLFDLNWYYGSPKGWVTNTRVLNEMAEKVK